MAMAALYRRGRKVRTSCRRAHAGRLSPRVAALSVRHATDDTEGGEALDYREATPLGQPDGPAPGHVDGRGTGAEDTILLR